MQHSSVFSPLASYSCWIISSFSWQLLDAPRISTQTKHSCLCEEIQPYLKKQSLSVFHLAQRLRPLLIVHFLEEGMSVLPPHHYTALLTFTAFLWLQRKCTVFKDTFNFRSCRTQACVFLPLLLPPAYPFLMVLGTSDNPSEEMMLLNEKLFSQHFTLWAFSHSIYNRQEWILRMMCPVASDISK